MESSNLQNENYTFECPEISTILYNGGYMRLFRAKYNQKFNNTGIIGRVQLVQYKQLKPSSTEAEATSLNFFCLQLSQKATTLWNYAIPCRGEFSFIQPSEDLVVFDGFDGQFMLQAQSSIEMCDLCQQLDAVKEKISVIESLDQLKTAISQQNDKIHSLTSQSQNNKISQVKNTAFHYFSNTINNSSPNPFRTQSGDAGRSTLRDLCSASAGSAESYLCLLGISQLLHRNAFPADVEVVPLIRAIQQTISVPVGITAKIRSVKVLKQIIQRIPCVATNEGIHLLEVATNTLKEACIYNNQTQNQLFVDHELVFYTTDLVKTLLAGRKIILEENIQNISSQELYNQVKNLDQQQKIQNTTYSVLKGIQQNNYNDNAIKLHNISNLQNLLNILIGLCIYITQENINNIKNDDFLLTISEDAGSFELKLQIKKVDIRTQSQFVPEYKYFNGQQLINALFCLIEATNNWQDKQSTQNDINTQYVLDQSMSCIQTQKQLKLKCPESDVKELSQFINLLISKLDYEICIYLHAYTNNKLQEYYLDSEYCNNIVSILGVLMFLFDANFENQQSLKNMIQIILNEKQSHNFKHLLALFKTMTFGNMFFIDNYQVQGFEVRGAQNAIQKHKKVIYSFINVIYSMNTFFNKIYAFVQKKSSTSQQLLGQIAFYQQELQIINAQLILKCLYCLNNIQYSPFSDIKQESNIQQIILDIINAYNQTISNINEQQITKHYVKTITQAITYCYNVIESDNQQFIRLGYNQEDIMRINSFSYNILILFISQLAQKVMGIMQSDRKQQASLCLKYFYEFSITRTIYQCLKISNEVLYKKYVQDNDNNDIFKPFKENLVMLCQLLILNNFKNYEQLKQQNSENQEREVQNLIDIFPRLISIQFSNINSTNINTIIEELEIYQSIRKTHIQQYLMNNQQQHKLLQGVVIFCNELLTNIVNQLNIELDENKSKGNQILVFHMLNCFISQIKDLISLTNLKPGLIQYLQDQLNPYNICELVLNILNLSTQNNDQQVQYLVVSTLEIFINYFQLNSSLKEFSQFMYIQIQKNSQWIKQLFTRFIKYIEDYRKVPSETYIMIIQNISLILMKITCILELDVFNKQSIIYLQQNHQIDVLQDQITTQKICQIFIDNDNIVTNIDTNKFTDIHEIINYWDHNYYNIEDRIQLVKLLTEYSDPYILNNVIITFYLIMQHLYNAILHSENQLLMMQEAQLLNYYISEQIITHLFTTIQQFKWGEEDQPTLIGSTLVIIKIITYLYQINPELLLRCQNIYQQIGKTIQQLNIVRQQDVEDKKQLNNASTHLYKLINSIMLHYSAQQEYKQIDKAIVQQIFKLLKQLIDELFKNQNSNVIDNIYVYYYFLKTLESVYTFMDKHQYGCMLFQTPDTLSNMICAYQVLIDQYENIQEEKQANLASNVITLIIKITQNIISSSKYNLIQGQIQVYDLQASDVTEAKQYVILMENMLQHNLQQNNGCIIQFFEKYFIFNTKIYKQFKYWQITRIFLQILDVLSTLFKANTQIVKQYKLILSQQTVEIFLLILYTTFNQYQKEYSLQLNGSINAIEIQMQIVQMLKTTFEKSVNNQEVFMQLQIIQSKLLEFLHEYIRFSNDYSKVSTDQLSNIIIQCLFSGLEYNYNILLQQEIMYLQQKNIDTSIVMIKNINQLIENLISYSELNILTIIDTQLQSLYKIIQNALDAYCEMKYDGQVYKSFNLNSSYIIASNLQESSVRKYLLLQQLWGYLSIMNQLLQTQQHKQAFIRHTQWLILVSRILLPNSVEYQLPLELIELCTLLVKNLVDKQTVDMLVLDNALHKPSSLTQLLIRYLKAVQVDAANIPAQSNAISNAIAALQGLLTITSDHFNRRLSALKTLQQAIHAAVKHVASLRTFGAAAKAANSLLDVVQLL